MLKFESWPPQLGEVDWAPGMLRHMGELAHDGDDHAISVVGRCVGSLLYNNVETTAGEDKDFTVQRIAVELTQGWRGGDLTETFMQAVADSANAPRAGSRPFTRVTADGSEQYTRVAPAAAKVKELLSSPGM